MSSTQHQLIEQCATRLRGIVEALDNIHDTSPQRWSTDLDDVHSSAESLLALIKDQAPARSDTSFEEWLANELEGEDGQPVPAAVCDIALARRAFNHWPKLEQPAKVGGVRFSAGVSSRLVVEAAQRLYEFEVTPEKEAERIERLQAFLEQLDPLNLAPHAEAFNEAPAEALKPEQAEAERPEVVAWSNWKVGTRSHVPFRTYEEAARSVNISEIAATQEGPYSVEQLMTVAQHERIVRALRAEIAEWQEAAGRSRSDVVAYIAERAKLLEERDAALARVAELEKQEPVGEVRESGGTLTAVIVRHSYATKLPVGTKLYAAPVAQAQHSVPRAWLDVQAERRRQVEAEGWTPEHDDEHSHGEMALAAASYAAYAHVELSGDLPMFWPWGRTWWKPTTPRRDLVKACALALAEIERLDRAAASQGGPSDA
ncbi:hypothetical protein AAA545_06405 [Pseudomonas aeruginosa]